MQALDTSEMAPDIERWEEQFRADGKVVFTHQLWTIVIVVIAFFVIASGAVYIGVDDLDPVAYQRTVGTMAVLLGLPLVWYLAIYRHRVVVVDEEGIHLPDSAVVPWKEAVSATVVRQRNRAAVGLTVTDEYMHGYQSRQRPLAALVTRLSSMSIQRNTLYFPQTLDVPMDAFAVWLERMIARQATMAPPSPEPSSPVWYDSLFTRGTRGRV